MAPCFPCVRRTAAPFGSRMRYKDWALSAVLSCVVAPVFHARDAKFPSKRNRRCLQGVTTMTEHKLVVSGQRILIQSEPEHPRLLLNDEEIRIRHHRGAKAFSTPYLPHVRYSSLESLAKALVQHRFPGGRP